MPYDIPRPYGYRIQPFKLEDDEKLVADMANQLLKARLAEARAVAGGRRRGGGGGGGAGGPGKGKGEWIMRLDSATGRYKPVWVPGKAAKDREKNLKGLDYNETKDRIEKNPEVSKLLDTLRSPAASNLTKQETLKKLNALRSDPSFSGLDKEAVGAAVADVVKPYASEVQEEKRKIESSGRLGALATGAKIAGEKFSTWLDELVNGDDAPQVIERSKASLERQRALRESDPYLREQDLRSAEEPEMQRGWKERTGGFANAATNFGTDLLSDPGLGLALAGGAVATAGTGGIAAPLAGAALAATGGAMSSDIMLQERLAGDDRLTDAERARAYEEGAFQEKAIGAGLNVLPAVTPAAIRGIQLSRAARGLEGAAALDARAARAAELNRFGAQMKYNVLPASAEAATVNAGQMVGSNLHYGSLTGQPVDPTEGVGHAAAAGALFGLGTGLGGAVRSARMRGAPPPVAPEVPPSPDGGAPVSPNRDAFIQEALARQEAEAQSKSKGGGTAPSSQGGQTPPPPAPPTPPAAPSAPQAPTPPAAPAAPSAPSAPQAPTPPAAPSAPQTPAPSAASASPQFSPRSAPNLTPEQLARVPELQELGRHVVPSRSAVWDKDPELAAARALADGSATPDDAAVAGDWASARFAELLIRDEAKIRGDRQVKKYLKQQEKAAKAKRQSDAEVQVAMESAPAGQLRTPANPPSPFDSVDTFLDSVGVLPGVPKSIYANPPLTTDNVPIRNTKKSSSTSKPANTSPSRQATVPAPSVPQATANATLQSTGIQPTANDLVNEVVKTFRGTAPKAATRAAKASASAKGRKSASFDYKQLNTTLSDKELGFISTAGAKKDEAMDSLMPADLATQAGADEVLRILDQALDARARGNSSKKLKNFIEGATRTLKYLQEIRNITPRREVPNAAGQPAAETAAPVQQSARAGEEGANPENSGADSGVAPNTGVSAEAPAGGAAPAVRVRRAKDKGVGDGRRPGGSTPAAPHSEGGSGIEGTGRESGSEGAVRESSPEQPAAVVPKPSESAGRAEHPAVAGNGSPAARGSSAEKLEALNASYALSKGFYPDSGLLVSDPAELRARALGRIAKIAPDAKRYPKLARHDLEYVYKVTGVGSRSDIEAAVNAAHNPYVKSTLRDVLALFRPGEDAPLAPPVQVAERLSKFLSLPRDRQFAVYDALSSLSTSKNKADANRLMPLLREAGLDSVDALNALRETAGRQWRSDSRADAKVRPDMEAKALADVRMRPLDLGPEDAEAAVLRPASEIAASEVRNALDERINTHPMSLLEDGVEKATSQFKEHLEVAQINKYKPLLEKAHADLPKEELQKYLANLSLDAARREYESLLPTPERMALMLNKFPDAKKLDTGSPEWFEASAPKVNRMISLMRGYATVKRGDPRWAQADADLTRMASAGFTKDFFDALVPGVDLFNTKAKAYEITANDLRNAYDPEGALRESIAAQKEGLPVCPS